MQIGFHASHEEWPPGELLRQMQRAEAAGFRAAMCSDHSHPWSEVQGQSGNAWCWLGAAMARSELTFGTVCAPGQRYHPATVAQAAATLAEMFPARFWLGVGSGEFLNEHVTGAPWPSKPLRQARLKECVDILRALWAGETVNHRGLVTVQDARLYTRPETAPKVIGAALSPATAKWMAPWVDGLITAGSRAEDLAKVVAAFRDNGGSDKPMYLQTAIAFARTQEEARTEAHRLWRQAVLSPDQLSDGTSPHEFDSMTRDTTLDAVEHALRVSCEVDQHRRWLLEDAALGFETVYVHFIGSDVDRAMDTFAVELLPEFHVSNAPSSANLKEMTVLED
jgi:coenzyme F420-dependent glucose-6-phosphate dehydrogenase